MKQQIDTIPFFFIIGRPRSGTYLLRSLLEGHPGISIPTECPLILNLFPKYGKFGFWDQNKIKDLCDDLFLHKELMNWKIDKDRLLNDWLGMEGEARYTDFIRVLYLSHQSAFDKKEIKLLGDKNPIYSTHIDEVFNIFPNAKYIHLTRDYRDQLVSIGNVDFESNIPSLITYRWKHANARMLELRKQFPERILFVRYEDLVAKPEFWLKKMCVFLEIEYSSLMLERFNKKDEVLTDFKDKEVEKYHQSLQQPLSTSKVLVWKDKLQNSKIRIADFIAGDLAEEYGYSRKYKNRSFLLFIKSAPGVVYGKAFDGFRLLILRLPFRFYIRIHYSLQILAPVYRFLRKLF
ncbi:MAG: sulfotransferase [Bacteroidales bacterium]|nr:sulfotransferase [Bacteroidales bacterium]